ncbi:MAG: LTA synthase family protein [Oscillospiraceae bacterium]|nr:LTA synthase family protein [Oscillospiraceae bacterium]
MLKNTINAIKTKQTDKTALILAQAYLALLGVSTVFFSLLSGTTEKINPFAWMTGHVPAFLLSFLLIFILAELIYLFTFRLLASLFVVYPVVILFSFVNYIKVFYRNEPFVFSDFLILKETGDIAGNYEIKPTGAVYWSVLFLVVLIVGALLIKRVKISLGWRLILPAAALLITVFFGAAALSPDSFVDRIYVSSTMDLTREYGENGFILGFAANYRRSLFFAPEHYDKNTAQRSAEALGYAAKQEIQAPLPEALPNVIVVMSESLWDCYNNLTGVAYNADPMEPVRGIMESHGSGQLLSPLFGGGTSNVEYEFLTGKSILYYPPHSIIYQQYITKKQWSLAWHFGGLGYSTLAVHPYCHWFWKRSTVFPLLGFENVYFDEDMKHTEKKGKFISDMSLSKEIIYRYEELSEGGSVPVFGFCISMQNHGGYYAETYGETEIKLTREADGKNEIACEVFGEGIRDASRAFLALAEYFENEARPTYIVMFGDHGPSFAGDKYLYALDEDVNMYPEDKFHQYVTPIVIWSNTGEKIGGIGTLTPIMLTARIFDIAHMPKPPYIQMLSGIGSVTAGFTHLYRLDSGGNLSEDPELMRKIDEINENLRYCQYDATLGKNYAIDEFR